MQESRDNKKEREYDTADCFWTPVVKLEFGVSLVNLHDEILSYKVYKERNVRKED